MSEKFNFILLDLPNESDQSDNLVAKAGGHLTQSLIYGRWQKALDRKVIRGIWQNKNGQTMAFAQIIKYKYQGKQNILYLPHGPVFFIRPKTELISVIIKTLKEIGQKEESIFIRLDPYPILKNNFWNNSLIKPKPDPQLSSFVQPSREWSLNLKGDLETLWQNLSKNTQREIKKGQKNLSVEVIDHNLSQHSDSFYNLLSTTAERHNFKLHPQKYYEQILKEDFNQFLVIIKANGEIVNMNLIVVYGQTATYLFGGSRVKSKGSYLAQWVAIEEAQKRNCLYYNLGGIADPDKPRKNLEGITYFKQKFPGRIIYYSSNYDLPIKKLWYYVYQLAKFLKLYVKKLH